MTVTGFIVGVIILGLLILISAFVVAGAITVASKETPEEPVLRQPEMKYLNEYDASDYLGITPEELEVLRAQGKLKGAFITIESVEDDGEEEYFDVDDNGNEVIDRRPVFRDTTRYLYSREMLDEKMAEMLREEKTLDLRS